MSNKQTVAIIYDFDKTLSTRDMQEYTFIPNINYKPKDFWKYSADLAKKNRMDNILAYMYAMVKLAKNADYRVTRDDFVELGKGVEFFPGVLEWFGRINEYGLSKDLLIQHYIISSGLKEIIEGTPIKSNFNAVFACEFYYDEFSAPVWPAVAVNYTAKTQFLFRINKGVLDITDDKSLNTYTPNHKRPIPFKKMIYIGDGPTDVPCMRLVKENGGQSIAVYQQGFERKVHDFLIDGRVDHIALADYSENSELDTLIKNILDRISASHILAAKHYEQLDSINKQKKPANK